MKKMFWLLGPPGSGKSTLMASLRPSPEPKEVNIKVPWTAASGKVFQKQLTYLQYSDRCIEFGRIHEHYSGADALEKIGHSWYFDWFLESQFEILLMEGKPDWWTDTSQRLLTGGRLDLHLYVLDVPADICHNRIWRREFLNPKMKKQNPTMTKARRAISDRIASHPATIVITDPVGRETLAILRNDPIIKEVNGW